VPEVIALYASGDTQRLGSLAYVARLDPEDGSIAPAAASDSLHSRDVDSSPSQLAKYVGDSTYAVLVLNKESNPGSHQLDSCLFCRRKEGPSVGRHEVELSTPNAYWETIEGNQINTPCLECLKNLGTPSSPIGNNSIVILNTPHDVCYDTPPMKKYPLDLS